jgi:hypothetical protein
MIALVTALYDSIHAQRATRLRRACRDRLLASPGEPVSLEDIAH